MQGAGVDVRMFAAELHLVLQQVAGMVRGAQSVKLMLVRTPAMTKMVCLPNAWSVAAMQCGHYAVVPCHYTGTVLSVQGEDQLAETARYSEPKGWHTHVAVPHTQADFRMRFRDVNAVLAAHDRN